ncbi:MAG: M81 family metallopeptidase [Gammaproteobacteria bacterium]|nr:M81 family metallopeptidase [Gammaproteobacteria bacterium]
MAQRIVMALMKHETNTFSPVPTDLARFAKGQSTPFYGAEAYRAYKGTGSCLGAFIDVAEAAGLEIVIPIAANAPPSGPVQAQAYAHMCEHVLGAVRDGCDAILLDLHGAMVTADHEDGEGTLLAQVREIAPDVPLGIALDMHTNLYPQIAENVNVLAGYHTYPHIDHIETGTRAAKPIVDMLAGRVQPTLAWGTRPMLPHVMRQGTDDEPNRSLQERCRQMEQSGVLAATVFTGFPHADIHNAGLSAVVVTDNEPERARELCDELLEDAWASREAFVYKIRPLADSLEEAKAIDTTESDSGPVILLDHYDNCASGGTQDTMTVLAAIIEAGFENVAAFAIHDPDAVRELIAAGVGATVTLPLGGKIDMPALGLKGQPYEVTGRVKLISAGQFRNQGPASTGVLMDMGPTVVLDTGKVEIVVISRHQEPNDLACFLSLGIDPREKSYLMLKSRIHYRAGFAKIAKAVVECAGTGVCTSDYDVLEFKNVRRPVYPLDLANEY